MRRFLPDSIVDWLVVIVVTGICASQLATTLFHNINRNQAIIALEDVRAAERIRERLAADPMLGEEVTVSFGVAEFPANGDTAENLISAADSVLYQAKKKGRDQVVVARAAGRVKVVGQ